jgi:hypothetical protein
MSLTGKCEFCSAKEENMDKVIKYFGLSIPLPIQKCMNGLDFEKMLNHWPLNCTYS